MSPKGRPSAARAACALLGVGGAVLAAGEPSLDALWRESRRYDRTTFRYVVPSADRLDAARGLGSAIVAASSGDAGAREALEAAARRAGLVVTGAQDAAGALRVAWEGPERREGAGLYAVRPGGVPVCIEAPHTFFDRGTGPVAVELFASLQAVCAAFNTVHRHAASDGSSDVAHARATVFAAVTEGLIRSGRWAIVQIHGFGARPELEGVDAVISAGGPAPDAAATRLASALGRELAPGRVLLAGRDTRALAATGNVEGAAARAAGVQFLHVELSPEARRRLGSDPLPLTRALRAALDLPERAR